MNISYFCHHFKGEKIGTQLDLGHLAIMWERLELNWDPPDFNPLLLSAEYLPLCRSHGKPCCVRLAVWLLSIKQRAFIHSFLHSYAILVLFCVTLDGLGEEQRLNLRKKITILS